MYIQAGNNRRLNPGAKLMIFDCDGTLTTETHWLLEYYLSQTQILIPHVFNKAMNFVARSRKPNTATIEYLRSKSLDPDLQILILTSRLFFLVPVTLIWLAENKVPFDTIVCRSDDEDSLGFKLDFITKNQARIQTIVDNDPRVLRGARKIIEGRVELFHPSELCFTS